MSSSYKIIGDYMKYIKYGLLIFVCVISFYISDQLLLYVENLSPIMQAINEVEDFDEYEAVNAIIDGNTIIPGKKGRVINKRESYLKMNDFGAFNETFYVYDYITPEISLNDNLDKIIIKGNKDDSLALIVESDKFDSYFLEENIAFTKLIDDKEKIITNDLVNYINSNNEENAFYDLNYYLKKNKKNDRLCLVGQSNINICKTLKYYLLEPNLNLYHSNVVNIKSSLSGGSILYIHDDVLLSELKVIIQSINQKNLDIISVKDLIKE